MKSIVESPEHFEEQTVRNIFHALATCDNLDNSKVAICMKLNKYIPWQYMMHHKSVNEILNHPRVAELIYQGMQSHVAEASHNPILPRGPRRRSRSLDSNGVDDEGIFKNPRVRDVLKDPRLLQLLENPRALDLLENLHLRERVPRQGL